MANFKLDEVKPTDKIKMLKYIKLVIEDLKTLGILRKSKIYQVRTGYKYNCGKKKHLTDYREPYNYIIKIVTNRTVYSIAPNIFEGPKCYIEKWYKTNWSIRKEFYIRRLEKYKNNKLNVL